MHISLLNGIIEGFMNWVESLFSIIPKYFYLMITMMLNLLDILQLVMRKVAGLDSLYFTTTGNYLDTSGGQDMVMTIMMQPAIKEAFLAMLAIGLLLVFVFTIIAILKTEYNSDDAKSASKSKIIGKALRGVGLMFLVPSLAFLGLTLSNLVLRTLDSVTMVPISPLSSSASEVLQPSYNYNIFGITFPSSATPLSGMAFRASAYKANRIRIDSDFATDLAKSGNMVDGPTFGGAFNPGTGSSIDQTGRERAARTVDDAFANNYLVLNGLSLNERLDNGNSNQIKKFANSVVLFVGINDIELNAISKFNVNLVWFYYDLWKFDFILAVAVVVTMSVLLLNITLGMMRRVYDIVILFIIAPAMASTLPLDDGGIFKKWRQKFVGKALAAYGPIVAMNLFFMIVPYISDISFFGTGTGSTYVPIMFADVVIQAFFVIVGLVAVKDISKMLSDFIGAEDAGEVGGKMSSEVVGTALKIAAVASGAGAVAGKMVSAGAKSAVAGKDLAKSGVSRMRAKGLEAKANREEAKVEKEFGIAKSRFVESGGDLTDLRRGKKDVREKFGKASKAYQEKKAKVAEIREKALLKNKESGGYLKDASTNIKQAGLNVKDSAMTAWKTPGLMFKGNPYLKAMEEGKGTKSAPSNIAENLSFGLYKKYADGVQYKKDKKEEKKKEEASREAKKAVNAQEEKKKD